ncbi:hypothetical protein Vadar_028460 [Vaccinium darrowii]|uniref:Uncharacterized protein n=1 Tax=Vaccinium darrowii TaxID=229202 RepID=A0ACB7Z878_9ERIC|nr:hypothetical protein Vadar_028460 [Vaccinium darrowii]
MAEALLIPAAKGILEVLLSLAKDPVTGQIKQAWGFEQDLKKLCRRLETIQGLLEAAENQNVTSKPMLAAWLKHLKAATCDAENVLDELAYEDLRRKIEMWAYEVLRLSSPESSYRDPRVIPRARRWGQGYRGKSAVRGQLDFFRGELDRLTYAGAPASGWSRRLDWVQAPGRG